MYNPLFKQFDMERICIDKVFFVVYDSQYSQQKHPFDKDVRDKHINNIKRSRIRKGKFADVIRKENNYSSWEMSLDGSRTMYHHVNVIHMLQQLNHITPQNVIYDDNFMPIDTNFDVVDYVKALDSYFQSAIELYHHFVKSHWGVDLDDIHIKIVQIELPLEIYPASVDDIARQMYADNISFKKYNTQSGTLYVDKPANPEVKMRFSERKYDKDFVVPLKSDLEPDIVYINKIDSERNDHKIQLKIYQKTFGLVRIEITAYSDDAKSIFSHSLNHDETADLLIRYVHHTLTVNNLNPARYDRSLDDVVHFLSKALKENEDIIYTLRKMDVFESCRANKNVRERLVRKGILIRKFDADGSQKRGVYLVNPIIRDFLNKYEPVGNEHFVGGGLVAPL